MRWLLCLTWLIAVAPAAVLAQTLDQPVSADSRIKTFVYNENEVYNLTVHHGYQANIEFGLHEDVQTISVGDRIGWQIIPAGRRLFIRALETKAHTNMTVITNKRSYQFDLRATPSSSDKDLVYVVRFFYPDEQMGKAPTAITPVSSTQMLSATAPTPPANFNYTFTGPDALAPSRIYDDGAATFFQFRPMQGPPPVIYGVRPDGTEVPMQTQVNNGYIVVPAVAPRFTIRHGNEVVCVYNENLVTAMAH